MCVFHPLSNEHHEILQAIFEKPCRSDISWPVIFSLFSAIEESYDAVMHELSDRLCLSVMHRGAERMGVFARPSQQNYASEHILESIQSFLNSVGITPLGH